ncbi:MAG: RNA methyltransferase [Verrucomicrobia bacterium]|nr:RNA methyltransferase [Verrucomicrobiota bacterium]
MATRITSLTNPRVKDAVKLRQRSHRDALGLLLIEGYREIKRALDNQFFPVELYFAPELFQGENEPALIARCEAQGVQLFECAAGVFQKMSYRDRPDGLLAVAKQPRPTLATLDVPANALLIVAESIEKPGNLGTILRSADAAGVHAVLVCDRCTDIYNPNVVRASIGTLFSVPVVEAPTDETLQWLHTRGIQLVAAMPAAEALYTDMDLTRPTAIIVGTEQYGLSEAWQQAADVRVRIPMLGQADSLNVASAATILLYEAQRQRGFKTRSLPG